MHLGDVLLLCCFGLRLTKGIRCSGGGAGPSACWSAGFWRGEGDCEFGGESGAAFSAEGGRSVSFMWTSPVWPSALRSSACRVWLLALDWGASSSPGSSTLSLDVKSGMEVSSIALSLPLFCASSSAKSLGSRNARQTRSCSGFTAVPRSLIIRSNRWRNSSANFLPPSISCVDTRRCPTRSSFSWLFDMSILYWS
jgi:hypothetical protein